MIQKLWCKGEVCKLKDFDTLYRVTKVYRDHFDRDYVRIHAVHKDEVLRLFDDRNLIKITQNDMKNSQLRLPVTLLLFNV